MYQPAVERPAGLCLSIDPINLISFHVRHEIKINIYVKKIDKAYKFKNTRSVFLKCKHIDLINS